MKHRSRYRKKNPTTQTYVLAGLGALTVAGIAYLLLRQQQQASVPLGVVTMGSGGSSTAPLGSAASSSATQASLAPGFQGQVPTGTQYIPPATPAEAPTYVDTSA